MGFKSLFCFSGGGPPSRAFASEFLVSLNGTGLAIVGAPDSCLKGWRDQESQHLKQAPEAAGFVKCFEWFLAHGRHGMSISMILVVISGEGRGSGARPHWA